MKRRPKSNPLSARIKRMMQADEDVGKIAGPTPVLIGKALEVFLKDLCEGASDVAIERQARTLTPGHMKHYVNSTPHLDFLKDKFADVADLPEQHAKSKPATARPPAAGRPVTAAKPKKRQRVEEPAMLPSTGEADRGQTMQPAMAAATFATAGVGSASQAAAVSVAAATTVGGESGAPGAADVATGTVSAQPAPDVAGLPTASMSAAGISVQGGASHAMAHVDSTAGGQHQVHHAPQAVAAEEDDYDAD